MADAVLRSWSHQLLNPAHSLGQVLLQLCLTDQDTVLSKVQFPPWQAFTSYLLLKPICKAHEGRDLDSLNGQSQVSRLVCQKHKTVNTHPPDK